MRQTLISAVILLVTFVSSGMTLRSGATQTCCCSTKSCAMHSHCGASCSLGEKQPVVTTIVAVIGSPFTLLRHDDTRTFVAAVPSTLIVHHTVPELPPPRSV